jgi:hypothetical protein
MDVPLVPPANGAGEVGISPARAAHWGETPAQEKKMRPLFRARVHPRRVLPARLHVPRPPLDVPPDALPLDPLSTVIGLPVVVVDHAETRSRADAP